MLPQLADARAPEEDWTGLKDARERRKLQNRLNVRAHRRRKAEADKRAEAQRVGLAEDDERRTQKSVVVVGRRRNAHAGLWRSVDETLVNHHQIYSPALNRPPYLNTFPLSSDHLLPLVQYNLVRASVTNAIILSLHQQLPPSDCGMNLSDMAFFPCPYLPRSLSLQSLVPPDLRPTPLQLATPHDLWLDLVPNPTLRDNLLEALREDRLDAIDLQVDLFGSICPTKLEKQRALMAKGVKSTSLSVIEREERRCRNLSEDGELGMLVWSDPWTIDGYEITEAFLHKWAFVLKGCWALLEATNRWRAYRGEEPLYAEL